MRVEPWHRYSELVARTAWLVFIVRWSILIAAVLGIAAAAMLVTSESPIEDPIWWYTNEQPPNLSIQGPSGPLRGAAQGTIRLEPPERSNIVAVTLDGQARTPTESSLTIDTRSLPDGPHRVEVLARDTSRRQNQSSAVWTFSSDNSPPELEARLDPADAPREGGTFVIRLSANEAPQSLQARLGDRELRLQPDGNGAYWVLEGITPDAPERALALKVTAADALGNSGVLERELPIQRTDFAEEDLELDPRRIGDEVRANENQRLAAIYARPNGTKRWEGRFRSPVEGDITTDFGTRRSYEFHPGTDFAAPRGTAVRAPGNGVVAFVGTVPARGNVLVLDHGAGVYSTYGHLDAHDVQEGAEVRAGQTIARVGTTGFSTGPHLHWEMWVNGANVDPMEWTRRSFP
jgi:murein DD-endopeptidase MepM/ murein hydrolase activator NlpD